MKRGTTAILLIVSLCVVLDVAAAIAVDGVEVIRLPSDVDVGKGDDVEHAHADAGRPSEEERPWKCCDRPLCTRSIPPRCRCLDTVRQCAGACKHCEKASSSPSRRVCMDWYHGWPGPSCTNKPKEGAGDQVLAAGAAPETTAKEAASAVTARPACCDKTVCNNSQPQRCICRDRLHECDPAACQACRQVSRGPDRYVCLDVYPGPPAPTCSAA